MVAIVWGGYRMITSNGNDETFKTGKQILTYAVIGLVLVIIANTIIFLISSIVPNLDIL